MPIGKAAQLGHQLRRQGAGEVVIGARSPSHFVRTHPLAEVAAERCNTAGHPEPGRVGPACGRCWETAIRNDERGAA
jgi:hypothetical protein